MSNFPLPGGVMVRTWEIVLPGGHIKNLTDKYIFQYSEHHKSENFPQLWWDTHIRVKKILEIKPRAVWNYRSLILYGQSQTIVVSYPSFLMLTLTWGINIFFDELTHQQWEGFILKNTQWTVCLRSSTKQSMIAVNSCLDLYLSCVDYLISFDLSNFGSESQKKYALKGTCCVKGWAGGSLVVVLPVEGKRMPWVRFIWGLGVGGNYVFTHLYMSYQLSKINSMLKSILLNLLDTLKILGRPQQKSIKLDGCLSESKKLRCTN